MIDIFDGPSKFVTYPQRLRKGGWGIREMRKMPRLVVVRHEDLKRLERIVEDCEVMRQAAVALIKDYPKEGR